MTTAPGAGNRARTDESTGGGAVAPERCATYLDPYRRMVAAAGPCFEALLWRSPESQRARFKAITDSVDLQGRTIADMGCGRADLAFWLREHKIEPGRYIGVEALAPLLECCRARAVSEGLPRAEFIQADFAADTGIFARLTAAGADAIVFSGSLNTFAQSDALVVLDRAWRAVREVRRGVLVFNFLSDGARPGRQPASGDDGPAHLFNTRRMLAWALRRTRGVVFRQDYLGGQDATVVMRGR